MTDDRVMYILVGPEDRQRLESVRLGHAPRVDYRLLADQYGGTVQEMYPSPAALRGRRPLRLVRSLSANTWAAARLFRSAPAGSVLYSTGETWGLPVGIVGALLGRKHSHVVAVHRVYSSTWLTMLRRLRSFLRVDGWICITSYQAGLLRQALGSADIPIGVVSQGVDTVFFDPAKAGPPDRAPYILAVGAEMRNYALLFEAVRELGIDLVVKASSAWMAGARDAIGDTSPGVTLIAERLSYAGLRDLYAGARLVVMPVYDTPQAAGITSILEAMAMKKCVVATRSRGLPDALIDGTTGLVVEPTADALASALSTLWQESDRADALAAAGQRLVRAEYSLEAHADAVGSFLHRTGLSE